MIQENLRLFSGLEVQYLVVDLGYLSGLQEKLHCMYQSKASSHHYWKWVERNHHMVFTMKDNNRGVAK